MNKRKFAIVVFIYKQATVYFKSLIDSINKQTNLDFDIIIFNDDIENVEIYFRELNVHFVVYNLKKGNPCDLRFEGIIILSKLEYDYYIFQDCDDELSFNRFSKISQFSNQYSFIVNDLDIIDEESRPIDFNIWSKRLDGTIFTYKNIEKFNFIGLGNTALSKSLLNYLPAKPSIDVVAADWYIFYCILKASKVEGYFTSQCSTRYRQHATNSIGIADEGKIINIIRIKEVFYDLVNLKDEKITTHFDHFIVPLKQKNNYPFWWELN
jgi:hypothetical protein